MLLTALNILGLIRMTTSAAILYFGFVAVFSWGSYRFGQLDMEEYLITEAMPDENENKTSGDIR